MLNGNYMSCGIPYSAWERTASLSETVTALTGRTGKNARMPYWLSIQENDQGVEIVTNNCLLCHGAMFEGEVIIGLGNEWLDFTDDPRALVNAVGTYVFDDKAAEAWRKWGRRLSTIAQYMITDTVGVNPAPNITLALIAHREPDTLAWSSEPLIEPPPRSPLPVSVPPWWRIGKKHALFYNGMGRGDHARFMMMKSLLCADTTEEAESIDSEFADVRAYIASLDPPRYPFPVDAQLADRGKDLFDTHCSSCHGTYGPGGSYPNLIVGLDTVGTDEAYARQAHEQSDRFADWFNRSWYGEIATARPALGYVAPPLDGIWITAPFLHNGSVPTLEALLDSSLRPRYWTRDSQLREFDKSAVGWKYSVLSHGKEDAGSAEQRKEIYDTTLFGYSNRGHTFGDVLSRTERMAVIEYLKTL
jgi:mono/diheme cytochrome c family protein